MKKIGSWKIACILTLFCAASAIASPAQTFSSIVSFDGTDGSFPYKAALVQGIDGNFYGETLDGGANDHGTVFKITPAGELTTLYSFCSETSGGICTDGASPLGGLALGLNGNFYGTTNLGGTGITSDCGLGCGTVFEVTPAGKLTTLYNFCSQTNCTDGNTPDAGLMLGRDGNFYGTTYYGGANVFGVAGTVFKITPAGALTTLYSFCSHEGTNGSCTDGSGPTAGLVQASNGNFYGSTSSGGAHSNGTIFQITPAGKLITLNSFTGLTEPNAMIQATNGNLYGTTYQGGAFGGGTVFEIDSAGKLTTLYSFCSQTNCADGSTPYAPPIQGTDGNLYGTTDGGGTGFGGTVYKITTAGALTTLYDFCNQGSSCTDGHGPEAALLQATNGTFYGTTFSGGTDNDGTVFNLSVGLGSFVQALPNFAKAGREIGILGNNLTGSTAVSFNGTPATTFTVVSDTLIKVTVPTGATTGTIEVTTPSGTLSSNVAFQVE